MRLPEPKAAKPDYGQPLQDGVGCGELGRAGGEEVDRVVDGQVEHLGDIEPNEPIVEHRGQKPFALAVLAERADARHHAQIRVDYAGPVAGRAGPFGVGAEERRLDVVGLRKRLADRLEQVGAGRSEDREAALRDVDVDVFQVVFAGALHKDEVVAVRGVSGRKGRARVILRRRGG